MIRTSVILLLCTACTMSAMQRGQKLEAAGDWNGAYLAYLDANRTGAPTEEEVAALERAKDALVAQDVAAGEAALAEGDFEGAHAAVERILDLDPDRPEAYNLRIAIEGRMAAMYLDRWNAGDIDGAYALAVRTKKLYPKAKVLETAFDQLHAAIEKKALQQLAKGQHADALATIRIITTYEPDRTDLVAPIEQKITFAWADALIAEAKRHQSARRLGATAVLYARAFEVAARPQDVDKARAIAADVGATGRLRAKLEVTGQGARATAVRTQLTEALGKVPDVAVVTTATSDLVVKVALGASTCSEAEVVHTAVAATGAEAVTVENPEYEANQAALAQANAEEAAAADEAARAAAEADAATAALRAVEDQLDAAENDVDAAEAAIDRAAEQLAQAKTRADELETQMDEQRAASAGASALAETERQVREVEVRIASYTDQVHTHEAERDAALKRVETLEADRATAAAAVDALEEGYSAEAQDRGKAKEKSTQAAGQLEGTEKEVVDDSGTYVRYDVHTWTRTCTTPATVTLKPASTWKTDLGPARSLAAAGDTKDEAHGAYPEANVAENPKAYTTTDAELATKADAAAASETAAWVATAADTFFADRRAAAVAPPTGDPKAATTAMVALYVGAPGRVDPPTAEVFATHARDVYGLGSLDVLRPPPSPPPAAAPAPPAAAEAEGAAE